MNLAGLKLLRIITAPPSCRPTPGARGCLLPVLAERVLEIDGEYVFLLQLAGLPYFPKNDYAETAGAAGRQVEEFTHGLYQTANEIWVLVADYHSRR